MAIMIPAVPREFDERSREGEMFHALEALPDEYTVVHSFTVLSHTESILYFDQAISSWNLLCLQRLP